MKSSIRNVATLALVSAACGVTCLAQTQKWKVRGEAIVTCPCKVPCPCRSNAPPSQSHCENLSYVRFVDGSYGRVKLDGLQYLWAADECSRPGRTPKPTTLYFPRDATAGQIGAIENIMTGGHCARGKAEQMRLTKVELDAGANGSVYSVRAGSKARLDVDIMPGPELMEPLPALDLWGNTVSYARNITARMDDPQAGLKWDFSGLQANYRTFDCDSEFAAKGQLLGLFRDDVGRFNDMHRSLIHELHLEVPLSRDDFTRMLDQVHLPARPVAAIRSDEHGSLGGTVFDPNGRPMSGARLTMQPSAAGFPQVAVANPNGRYFFARVPAGAYQVCASSWDGKTLMRDCRESDVKSGQPVSQDFRLAIQQAATVN